MYGELVCDCQWTQRVGLESPGIGLSAIPGAAEINQALEMKENLWLVPLEKSI